MKKIAFLSLAVLAAPILATAQTSIESLAAGAHSLEAPTFSKLEAGFRAPAVSALHRPFSGTIAGTFAGGPVNLVLNRYAWDITGRVGSSPVDVNIDNQNGTFTGEEGQSRVALSFQWSPDIIRISGTDGGAPYDVTLNVTGGVISGTAEGAPLKAAFRMDGGPIQGSNTGDISLNYDAVSGRVNGVINGSPIDVTLTDLDLSDFMEHLYLFLAPQP
ncbi:MAG TPA: hypothetical protein VNK24_04080 [Elusimicrobiota bacterium]|nr:hypothetical protein [Elusimicrobiota bacterium]HVC09504.1 hypothetical protein [Elusimicrobiota bacterium]